MSGRVATASRGVEVEEGARLRRLLASSLARFSPRRQRANGCQSNFSRVFAATPSSWQPPPATTSPILLQTLSANCSEMEASLSSPRPARNLPKQVKRPKAGQRSSSHTTTLQPSRMGTSARMSKPSGGFELNEPMQRLSTSVRTEQTEIEEQKRAIRRFQLGFTRPSQTKP